MKILQLAVELFHANGRTDMTKLIIAFCIFVKAPKKAARQQDTSGKNKLLRSTVEEMSLLQV